MVAANSYSSTPHGVQVRSFPRQCEKSRTSDGRPPDAVRRLAKRAGTGPRPASRWRRSPRPFIASCAKADRRPSVFLLHDGTRRERIGIRTSTADSEGNRSFGGADRDDSYSDSNASWTFLLISALSSASAACWINPRPDFLQFDGGYVIV
jgi:hypothetical protein